jgi:hypothetical protein
MTLERWSHWAEIGASVAVVLTLLLLVQQVRQNTLMLERQVALDRATAFNAPYLGESEFPAILEQIKTVDGPEPVEQAFVARYDLTYQQAIRWVRHLALVWTALESDYVANGRSDPLDAVAWSLLGSRDNQLYWENGAPQITNGGFRQYVSTLRSAEP